MKIIVDFCWFCFVYLEKRSLLVASTSMGNFLLTVFCPTLLCSTSLILSFSHFCPLSIVLSGLAAVAAPIFKQPEGQAEGDPGSNSPRAQGIEEVHESMAGICEHPQGKETSEWWVKMVSKGRSCLGHRYVYYSRHCSASCSLNRWWGATWPVHCCRPGWLKFCTELSGRSAALHMI